jgi:membrane protein
VERFTSRSPRVIIALAKETFGQWSQDNAPRLAAALAYYAILSVAPLLVISVAVAGFVYGRQAVEGQLAWELRSVVGANAAEAIQAFVGHAYQPTNGVIATVLGVVTLLVGASSVVVELRGALNQIWGVSPPSDSTVAGDILRFLRERFFSALVVIGAGCLLLISVIVSAFIATIGKFFRPLLPTSEWVLHAGAFAVSLVVFMLFFAAIYKFLPDVRLLWNDVLIGAGVTSLLFTTGKQMLAVYLGRFGFESTYGAAWAAVLFLIWVYYSAQLFFLGAEFTKVYTRTYGSHWTGTR